MLPTLASILGFDLPTDRPIDGEDFSAILTGGEFERERSLFWEFDDVAGFHYALRDGDWKLLADKSLERLELYNLAEDRFEVHNQAKGHPARVKAMVAELNGIAESVRTEPLRPTWVQSNREGAE